jgi:DNA replication and repair protein RecF
VELRRLWLTDFRNYRSLDLELGGGCTVLVGDNGQGKTNLVEAVAFLSTLESFRGAPPEALVRDGADAAVARAVVERDGREQLIEIELPREGRVRARVNGQGLRRARDLLGALVVTVFAPDDLVLVKGGPGERRRLLDEALVALRPAHDAVRSELERVLRQRNALLRQVGGRLGDEAACTLDVWDERLATVGEQLADLRRALVDDLGPHVRDAYCALAPGAVEVELSYRPSWDGRGLRATLAQVRSEDLRWSTTTVGPHRDDLVLAIDHRPARSRASQGEQRTLALALRLATHRLLTGRLGSSPVLVLDDVLSELDPVRGASLLSHLPAGQILLTTAAPPPPGVNPATVARVSAGCVGPTAGGMP